MHTPRNRPGTEPLKFSKPPERLSTVWPNVFCAQWPKENGTFQDADFRLESILCDDTTIECVQEEVVRRYNGYDEIKAENERLREAVEDAALRFHEIATPDVYPSPVEDRIKIAESARGRMEDALDGGGESNE